MSGKPRKWNAGVAKGKRGRREIQTSEVIGRKESQNGTTAIDAVAEPPGSASIADPPICDSLRLINFSWIRRFFDRVLATKDHKDLKEKLPAFYVIFRAKKSDPSLRLSAFARGINILAEGILTFD